MLAGLPVLHQRFVLQVFFFFLQRFGPLWRAMQMDVRQASTSDFLGEKSGVKKIMRKGKKEKKTPCNCPINNVYRILCHIFLVGQKKTLHFVFFSLLCVFVFCGVFFAIVST